MASRNRRDKRRQHAYRPAKGRPGIKFTGSHKCAGCGKWCYQTRDAAEKAVRQMHPGSTVHYYQCLLIPDRWWHFTSMSAEQQAQIREQQAVIPDEEWPEEKSA